MKEMAEAQILSSDAYIATKDGKFAVGTGQPDPEPRSMDHTEVNFCEGKVANFGRLIAIPT